SSRRASGRSSPASRFRARAVRESRSRTGSPMGRIHAIAGLLALVSAAAGAAPARDGLRDLYFGEALYHAYLGEYFDAIARLDTELGQHYALDEPELDPLHYHVGEAEFSVGDFELHYRMHLRAGRAI